MGKTLPQKTNLRREEWDFSKLQEEEIEACVRYEYAREIQNWEKYFAAILRGPEIEEAMKSKERLLFPPSVFVLMSEPDAASGIWPGFYPEVPWQSVPEGERVEVAKGYAWGKSAVLGIEREFFKAQESYHPLYAISARGIQNVPILIDWKQSNASIVDDFKSWVEKNRPGNVEASVERGRKSFYDNLNALGALRLRHHYSSVQASLITEKAIGRPLYSQTFSWDRAAKKAAAFFREMFPKAGKPRSAEMKVNPRGRPVKGDARASATVYKIAGVDASAEYAARLAQNKSHRK